MDRDQAAHKQGAGWVIPHLHLDNRSESRNLV